MFGEWAVMTHADLESLFPEIRPCDKFENQMRPIAVLLLRSITGLPVAVKLFYTNGQPFMSGVVRILPHTDGVCYSASPGMNHIDPNQGAIICPDPRMAIRVNYLISKWQNPMPVFCPQDAMTAQYFETRPSNLMVCGTSARDLEWGLTFEQEVRCVNFNSAAHHAIPHFFRPRVIHRALDSNGMDTVSRLSVELAANGRRACMPTLARILSGQAAHDGWKAALFQSMMRELGLQHHELLELLNPHMDVLQFEVDGVQYILRDGCFHKKDGRNNNLYTKITNFGARIRTKYVRQAHQRGRPGTSYEIFVWQGSWNFSFIIPQKTLTSSPAFYRHLRNAWEEAGALMPLHIKNRAARIVLPKLIQQSSLYPYTIYGSPQQV
jgi:hypothetical protein